MAISLEEIQDDYDLSVQGTLQDWKQLGDAQIGNFQEYLSQSLTAEEGEEANGEPSICRLPRVVLTPSQILNANSIFARAWTQLSEDRYVEEAVMVHLQEAVMVHLQETAMVHLQEAAMVHLQEAGMVHLQEAAMEAVMLHLQEAGMVHLQEAAMVHLQEAAMVHLQDAGMVHLQEAAMVHLQEAAMEDPPQFPHNSTVQDLLPTLQGTLNRVGNRARDHYEGTLLHSLLQDGTVIPNHLRQGNSVCQNDKRGAAAVAAVCGKPKGQMALSARDGEDEIQSIRLAKSFLTAQQR
eukprot:gene4568-5590_t